MSTDAQTKAGDFAASIDIINNCFQRSAGTHGERPNAGFAIVRTIDARKRPAAGKIQNRRAL